MMNTLNHTPVMKGRSRDEYEFILEDYELAFPKIQLEQIVIAWNNGNSIEIISKRFKRKKEEVFLAIFDQALKNKNVRPWR